MGRGTTRSLFPARPTGRQKVDSFRQEWQTIPDVSTIVARFRSWRNFFDEFGLTTSSDREELNEGFTRKHGYPPIESRFPMRSLLMFVALLGVALLNSGDAKAECPPWRPCGAGNAWGGNRLVPQGFYGADFRNACANHDYNYNNHTMCRRDCDRQFLNDMYEAAECSNNPAAARRKARHYYVATRLLGWTCY